ncbi:AAA family ATPase [Aeoliella sp. SH292]|uniref:cold-shock protein n=1 Tax=Aeoliella sp. SH292 TaxID=3454464 RepID=UPI003F94A6B5
MEPLDVAFEKFGVFVKEVSETAYWASIESEADTRLKVIDRVFAHILGWPISQIHLESDAGKKFIDYRCTVGDLNRLIIEAKRASRDLGIKPDHAGRFFKLNGAVFSTEAAREGIDQAIFYCGHKGAELACMTNGMQWAVFRGAKGPDGRDILDGVACVFGSLEAVSKEFKTFYELLSYESVSDYTYRGIFRQAEGQPLRHKSVKVVARNPDSKSLMKADKLSIDLDRIMQTFFRDLRSQEDAEARKACFVTTEESSTAEQGLTRISEELRDKVRALGGVEANELEEAIKRVQEMKKNELVLLVGTKGAGKSTFIDRFFEDVLSTKILADCVVVRVDLSKSGGTVAITKWLDEHFLEAAEQATFPNGPPTYDQIQGMFWGEYQRWMLGHAQHLYETDKTRFKIDFGRHIESIRHDRPHEYIKHILFWIVKGLGKVPCLVFDNADHFNVPFQEEVFNYAYSLYQEALCLVILPITDTTSWQLSKQGPIQSFYTDSFFLPTPPTDLILRRRIEFIERRIAEEQASAGKKPEVGKGYFFSRGIPLEIENIRGFAACLQTVFLNTGQVAEWIGRLANHDIRRCLQFTRETVASPHIDVAELVAAHVAKTSMTVNSDDVKMAMIRGRYDIYFPTVQSYVQNLYNLVPEYETTPLLPLRILQFMESAYAGNEENDGRYVLIDEVVEYFQALDIDSRVSMACLDGMLTRGLCVSYDPTSQGIKDTVKVEIAPNGRQHLAWGQRDWVYIESMAEITPMYDPEACDRIRASVSDGAAHLRRLAIATFVQYLIQEDSHFCVIPKHHSYQDQERLLTTLSQQLTLLSSATSLTSSRYRRETGRLTVWKAEGRYGFVKQDGGGKDAFLHIGDVLNPSDDRVPIGAAIEYEVVDSTQGPKAVSALILS